MLSENLNHIALHSSGSYLLQSPSCCSLSDFSCLPISGCQQILTGKTLLNVPVHTLRQALSSGMNLQANKQI